MIEKITQKIDDMLEWGGIRRKVIVLAAAALSLLCSFIWGESLPIDPAWVAIILCGVPIVLEAVIGLVTEFDIRADVLVAMALIASVFIGEEFAAGEVAFIMELGELLEDMTVSKARAGIERLVRLTPVRARILQDGEEREIAVEQVRKGDLLRVRPGETVPVDGVIEEGSTSIDEALLTGESVPADKERGDAVSAGTINRFGAFDMRAVRVGEDSAIQRMVRLVQSADAKKAKIVGIADRWATWIVLIALAASIVTYFFTREIIRSVTILVVFCPCALVLATPTAMMAAIGNATRHGFLVREGDALERLSGVQKLIFDKTGTLTCGSLSVAEVAAFEGFDRSTLYALLAGAEEKSEHPIARAICSCFAEEGIPAKETGEFSMIPGRGVCAVVEGKNVVAGNPALLKEKGVTLTDEILLSAQEKLDEGCTVIYAAVDGVPAGFAALADTVRGNAPETVRGIREEGIETVLLTGDNRRAAASVSQRFGIEEYRAECLPEDKLAYIEETKEKTCMVGDGINDAPALKSAYVGIAMGGVGSDIAVEAADIVLIHDDIHEIPHLLRLSKRMMKTIRFNLVISMTLNFISIVLAATGLLGPVVGALVHNCGSVFVIANSARLLADRRNQ